VRSRARRVAVCGVDVDTEGSESRDARVRHIASRRAFDTSRARATETRAIMPCARAVALAPARAPCATKPRANRRRAKPLARANEGDGLREALSAAQQAPDNVTERDFSNYYKVLNSQSPEEAQEVVDAMSASGELTEGVVEAALATMQTAESKGERPEIVQALKGVFEYLLESYQRANAPAELSVIDAVVAKLNALEESDDDAKAEENVVLECVREANMDVKAFEQSLDGFLVAMEEQDAQFDAQVREMREKGVAPEQAEQIEQLVYMRANAKAQMLCIRDITQRINA
jgi:hypothetical protein